MMDVFALRKSFIQRYSHAFIHTHITTITKGKNHLAREALTQDIQLPNYIHHQKLKK